jgi:hypothetical protein
MLNEAAAANGRNFTRKKRKIIEDFVIITVMIRQQFFQTFKNELNELAIESS